MIRRPKRKPVNALPCIAKRLECARLAGAFGGGLASSKGKSGSKLRALQTLRDMLAPSLVLSGFCLLLVSCSKPIAPESVVLTQSPRATIQKLAADSFDLRYPEGTRVVLVNPAEKTGKVRVLSRGFFAAAEPVVSYDGQRVVFAGKQTREANWQIYGTPLAGGSVMNLTTAPGGAADPALLADGSLLFVSPPPRGSANLSDTPRSTLYVQTPGAQPHRLTFSTSDISNPTVLSDGRILFVSSQRVATGGSQTGTALYTMNNDGTEVSAFAGQHDTPATIQRPRQLADGRIAFVVRDATNQQVGQAEYVLSSRPFAHRMPLLHSTRKVRSVEQAPNGDVLVCSEAADGSAGFCPPWALFRFNLECASLGTASFIDPVWDTIEAVPAIASRRPMGRLSSVDLSRKTGQILCLNANNSTYGTSPGQPEVKATRIRLFSKKPTGVQFVLGEVELQLDGSFMAEVPADIPLGFEALNDQGEVLRREAAMIWVRPGENRSCVGCHEPHNHSPHNLRPMAVRVPVPRLMGETTRLAQTASPP